MCIKCKYEPDSDLCADAATDLAQTTQMKERRGSKLRDVLIHCQFSIKVCAEMEWYGMVFNLLKNT